MHYLQLDFFGVPLWVYIVFIVCSLLAMRWAWIAIRKASSRRYYQSIADTHYENLRLLAVEKLSEVRNVRVTKIYSGALVSFSFAGSLTDNTLEELKDLAASAARRVSYKQFRELKRTNDITNSQGTGSLFLAEDCLANLFFAQDMGVKLNNPYEELEEAIKYFKFAQV